MFDYGLFIRFVFLYIFSMLIIASIMLSLKQQISPAVTTSILWFLTVRFVYKYGKNRKKICNSNDIIILLIINLLIQTIFCFLNIHKFGEQLHTMAYLAKFIGVIFGQSVGVWILIWLSNKDIKRKNVIVG